jgi:hypothetical protein
VTRRTWVLTFSAILVAGLAFGLWPHHIDSTYSEDVACGSPFFPDSGPSGNVTNYWQTSLGFGDQTVESSSERADACADVMRDFQAAGVFSLGAGLVGFAVLAYRTFGAALMAQASIESPAPVHPGSSPDVSTSADAREVYWRSQGWVPADEIEEPPPGWVRIDAPEPHP